jgi:hypothetical protein
MRALVVFLCLAAASASAQTVELGGRFGVGCAGTEDSLCTGASPLFGVNASVWTGASLELSAQYARISREDLAFRAFDDPVDITVKDRKRDFVSFFFVYHFMKNRAVRPMLGLGSGWYSEASRSSCQPAGCQTVLRFGPVLGQYRTWDVDAIFVMGLSGNVVDRWVWRGGWQSHRFGNDGNSTQQFFVAAGYRFGLD